MSLVVNNGIGLLKETGNAIWGINRGFKCYWPGGYPSMGKVLSISLFFQYPNIKILHY